MNPGALAVGGCYEVEMGIRAGSAAGVEARGELERDVGGDAARREEWLERGDARAASVDIVDGMDAGPEAGDVRGVRNEADAIPVDAEVRIR